MGLVAACLLSPVAHAQDAGTQFFESKIRPVLAEHCYSCHSATAKKIKGGLLLDTRPGWQKGGDSGPAIVPGHPEKSLLIKALHFGDDLKMPPKAKLPAAVIADFEAWVKMGAPDPRDKIAVAKSDASWDEILRTRRDWWSLKPVASPTIPKTKSPSPHPIDHFLAVKQEAKSLTPAAFADAPTLARRLSLLLTGLPPTPEQLDDFIKTCGPKQDGPLPAAAVEKYVDSLLASPHFGERWARHWMDVVRFSETHGNEWNYDIHHAWRYRDYLIRAFNDDVPYDRLVREHIAGDLLNPRWNEKEKFNESILGTAFYRFGEVNHDDCLTLPQIGYDLVDNQIDTLTKAFQAMTVACARCHDHKLDAVSLKDYHGLLGVLRSSRQVAHTIDHPDVNADLLDKMRQTKLALRAGMADGWRVQIPKALAQLESLDDPKLPIENPLWFLSQLVHEQKEKTPFADAWAKVTKSLAAQADERREFNKRFTVLADFRQGAWPDWQVGGQGLRGSPSKAGDFAVSSDGDKFTTSILPAGAYTNVLSSRLNGTLRSPVLSATLAAGKKSISFRVRGEKTSAVRLVSNNCQLNYANYKALTSNDWAWVTFPIPENAASLRIYAELMTKFDNPKFPDQLGTLGGDKVNDRVPFEKAAADPHSHFGITHVVVHDNAGTPKDELAYARDFLDLIGPAGKPPASMNEFLDLFRHQLDRTLTRWRDDRSTDADAGLLDAMLARGLFRNSLGDVAGLPERAAEYRKMESQLALPRIAPGLADFGPGFEQPVFVRGDCTKPGERTPRRYVEVLSPTPFPPEGSGRLDLAAEIAAPTNPLTARVLVNRVWHHLFGAGLVRTVDDFGHVGELPSHPELLDHLATNFVKDGWSIKRLVRSIALSHAMQRSHQPSPAALEADPENRLLQHYPAHRLEAEAIRDSIVFASGRLDRSLYGPSIHSYREKDYADRRLFKGPLDGHGRRSLYIKATLMEAPKFLEAFDLPGGKVCQGRRDVTNVPAQALALLNDPFVAQQADFWSKRLIQRKDDSVESRVAEMFRVALSREPRSEERERFAKFVAQVAEIHNVPADGVLGSAPVWRDVAHAMFNVQEFVAIP